jgi:hypothetical protein
MISTFSPEHNLMTENLRLIASMFCKQYGAEARAFIDDAHPSGHRHLVMHYGQTGGYKGAPEFAAAIPDDWSEKDVMDLLLWPMKDEKAPYPAWEVPARAYGSATLFRFWAGAKPQ